jgi:hypothetical protein
MKRLKAFAILVWGCGLLVLVAALAFGSGLAAQAVPWLVPATGTAAATPTPIPSESPTPYPTPSETASLTSTAFPTPTPTPRPTFTPTPLPFASGPVVIGTSVAGRPIEVYRFGTGPVERLTVHGIHGGAEWNTVSLADEFIAELNQHPERIPENITFYILRNLNPDGEARVHGVNGRVNDHGVDLNRNWNAQWKPEWNLDGCWQYTDVTGGPYPFSEPESVALRDFILSHDISAMIVYHSAALGIFPGGQPETDGSIRLARAIADITSYPYPPITNGCEFTGDVTDWAATKGIAAVTLELTNHTDTDFMINLGVLDVLWKWE